MAQDNRDRSAVEPTTENNPLHELLNSHRWVTDDDACSQVLTHSSHSGFFDAEIGEASEVLNDGTAGDLNAARAYWAMYADIIIIDGANDNQHD